MPATFRRPSAVAWLVVSSLLFGVMALFAKAAAARLPGSEVAFVRFAIGLATVAVVHLAWGPLRIGNARALALRGGFGGFAVLCYFLAIEHLPVGSATLLNYTAPVFATIFSAWFLGEALSFATVGALLVTFGGVVLVVHGHAAPGAPLVGVLGAFGPWQLVGVASSILSGAAVTVIRAARRTDGPWEIFGALCAVGLPITFIAAAPRWVWPDAREWGLLAMVGLVSVAAQILFTRALRDVAAATYGVIMQVTPVSTFALGAVLFDEPVNAEVLAGGALTLAGVVWVLARPTSTGSSAA